MYIDSHCHLDKLDLAPYDGQFDTLLDAAFAQDISRILCVAIELDSFEAMYQLIADHPRVSASLGVHPLHIESAVDIPEVQALMAQAASYEKVVALGETGLDYYYQTDTKEWQQQSFIHHMQAASQLELPVIVHTRNAREDTLELIRQHCGNQGGVLHCFTESKEMALKAIDMGFYISFSGIITFKNAAELREVVQVVPLEKILIETDAPYLAPVPYRGKKNEPKYVVEVAKCIADLRGIALEQVAETTSANFYNLFSKASPLV